MNTGLEEIDTRRRWARNWRADVSAAVDRCGRKEFGTPSPPFNRYDDKTSGASVVHYVSAWALAPYVCVALPISSALSGCEPLRDLDQLANPHVTSQCAITPRHFLVVPDVQIPRAQVPQSILNDCRRSPAFLSGRPPAHWAYNSVTSPIITSCIVKRNVL